MGVISSHEFQQNYDAQTARMLRPRFMWFLGAVGLLYLLTLLLVGMPVALAASGLIPGMSDVATAMIKGFRGGRIGLWVLGGLTLLDIAVYAWCWFRILRRPMPREEMAAFTQRYLIFRGVMDIAAGFLAYQVGFPWFIMFYHVLACIFLPWSPTQALRPMAPLLVINAILILVFRASPAWVKAIVLVLSLLSAFPGWGIASLKQSRRMERFRMQMLQTRYGQMRRELVDARRIHEALFPAPINTGPIRLDYRYEPMRQIGGDYLYARFAPHPDPLGSRPGKFNLLLLDVTGHGIAAALTVNRLYGEVERLFAEDPNVGPGSVLAALNRYVNLTLANHSVFATALCIRIDHEAGTLEYASGGHPPAYICRTDARIEPLDSTSPVLGACTAGEFDPCVQTRRFVTGDRLFAYTDGAIEARNESGRMLGIEGLLRVLNSCTREADAISRGISQTVLSAVEGHRYGPPEDDTLIVEVVAAIALPGDYIIDPLAGLDGATQRQAEASGV